MSGIVQTEIVANHEAAPADRQGLTGLVNGLALSVLLWALIFIAVNWLVG